MKPRINFVVLLGILALSIWLGGLVGCQKGDNYGDCSGDDSCNIYPQPPPPTVCAAGETLITLWVDSDNDDLAEQYTGNGITMDVCAGNSAHIPDGWTETPGPPWDPCPNDPTNQCGTTNPAITITAVANGHTVTINATPVYTSGTITSVDFYSGTVLLATDTSPNPWQYIWTNVPDGVYTLHATCYTNDGKTATSNNVTINIGSGSCVPRLRCSYSISEGNRFHGISIGCLTSINGQDPSWQWLPFQTCGAPNNVCTFEGNLWANALNMASCEFNGPAPSGLNGNPIPSFTSIFGYETDWLLTRVQNGSTLQYNDEMLPGSLQCEINPQCTGWVDVDTGYINHIWGANYWLDFTNITDPVSGNSINIFIGTQVDSDGDGFYNYCPPGTLNCTPDNCIRFSNPGQEPGSIPNVGAACLNHPNPAENDSDNDWYLDGEDLYPFDRTRH